MKNAIHLFKKLVKLILWILLILVLFFVVIAVIIQLPAIQKKLIYYSTSFISDKTHTSVYINNIGIYFPQTIVITGLYLDDLHKDTLLYAECIKVNLSFRDLFYNKIHINLFQFDNAYININRSKTDSLFNYNFLITAFSDTTNKADSLPSKWSVRIDKVSLKNIHFTDIDCYGGMIVNSKSKQIQIKGISVYQKKNDWIVSAKAIHVENNLLAYISIDKPTIQHAFDASHILFTHVLLYATDFYYSPSLTNISIKTFSAIDKNNFAILNFATNFSMDAHSFTNNKLKLETTHSSVNADICISYSSLQSLVDSLPSIRINTQIINANICNSDILYFVPQLMEQDFFKNKLNKTIITGNVNGTLNNLKGNTILIRTGFNSSLQTDFTITGLPDYKTAYFNLPNLVIQSGKKDIPLFTNAINYESIDIPNEINIHLNFKGQLNSFKSIVNISSSFGSAQLFVALDKHENYTSSAVIKAFDVGALLKNKSMYGPLSVRVNTYGHGLNGNSIHADIVNLLITLKGNSYFIDTIKIISLNERTKTNFSLKSPLVDITYNGAVSPMDIQPELMTFLNKYFPFSNQNQNQKQTNKRLANFNIDIQLYNHPIIEEVLPQLTEFKPQLFKFSFNSMSNELKLNIPISKIIYGTTEINNFLLDVNSDIHVLNYMVSSSKISNSQLKLDNFLVNGNIADNKIELNISSIDSMQNKKIVLGSTLTKSNSNFKLVLNPANLFVMNERWDVAADNYIEFGKQGYLIHNLFISNTDGQINIASVHNAFNDDLSIIIKNFKLDNISHIIEKDSNMFKGTVDGNIVLKPINKTLGLIADAKISDLFFKEIPIGDLSVKAQNQQANKFDFDINLSGAGNNLTAKGFYMDSTFSIKSDIQSLSMKSIEAFSMGQIKEASGIIAGNFTIAGSTSAPLFTGELLFNNAFVTSTFLNNRLEFKHEFIQFKNDGIIFKSFTIRDAYQHSAVIDGSVTTNDFQDFKSALQIKSNDFLVFNTTAKENKEFFGRMIIDSKIDISGPLSLPVINAKIKMKKGSYFTVAVPDDELTQDIGNGIVEFNQLPKSISNASNSSIQENPKSGLNGYDISAIIEIDKQATLKLLLDPASTDSLVVKGEAALSYALDQSGKMSLTGTYLLNEGSYMVSLESVIKRKFDIASGSTISWNGDPLDANISINAVYAVSASPIDLVSGQLSGLSEADKNGYMQRYPFLILLKLHGAILQPEISFEIQLPPQEKGILGGAVNAKLNMLNDDPSELNKQVFALLVLGRFIQENSLQTETSGVSDAVRTTVGRILSEQLNQLSSKVVSGVDLNFDIQSYEDYQTGQAQGRTQVDIGVKKQLFNERLSVQVGGSVDVEGEKAKQNSASDISSDVTIEYKLTDDNRYRLKGFRHNQYEGAIEGQLVETGAGVVFVRDFNAWKELYKKRKK